MIVGARATMASFEVTLITTSRFAHYSSVGVTLLTQLALCHTTTQLHD